MPSHFLIEWRNAIEWSKENGKAAYLYDVYYEDDDRLEQRLIARTMHPSFMAVQTTKHDPERDQ